MWASSARLLLAGLVLLALTSLSVQAARRKQMTRALRTDKAALMALKNTISDYGRSKIAAWKPRGNPCFLKSWPHITCSAGRVSSIDLSNLDIVGTLPAKLKNLNRLTVLNLENNRFTGEIPAKWAHRGKLRNLQIINLANNMLTGDLPNRKWNSRKALRSVETLDLSQNNLSGGLPDGWMSTANTFRKLKFLDLSQNMLGFNSDGSPMASYTGSNSGWCLEGRTQDSGWCPAQVSKARAASLQILDLSDNGLSGLLPAQWSQMFPELQFLLIQRNSFYPSDDAPGAPGALPDAWTRRTVPRAFPQLEALVLYPGNAMICSVLDLDANSFSDINGAMSYMVEDDAGMEFDSENPWFCPGPAADNPPTSVAVVIDEDDNTMKLTWAAPVGDNMATLVFGYSFSLTKYNPDLETFAIVPGWTARTVKVYGGNSDGLEGDHSTGYSLDTGIVPEGVYQLEVTTINMDGVESSSATANSPPPQCPESGAYTCGSGLEECSCAPGYTCDPTSQTCTSVAAVLIAFKGTFDTWTTSKIPNGWTDATQNPCGTKNNGAWENGWTGITCNAGGDVTEIVLEYLQRQLKGTLPADGYVLPSTLEVLNLKINYISGTIPASWRLPQELRVFNFEGCGLSGSIPADFAANLPATIDYFDVYDNGLTGPIPPFPNYKDGSTYRFGGATKQSGDLPDFGVEGREASFAIFPSLSSFTGTVPSGSIKWKNGANVIPAGTDMSTYDPIA